MHHFNNIIYNTFAIYCHFIESNHVLLLIFVLQIVQLLLTAGCEVNKPTPFDALTALHFACRLKDNFIAYEIVKELVSHGADVNQPDHAQCTAIILSSEQGHVNIVRFLIDHGADIDHQASEVEYPIAVTWSLENLTLCEKDTDEMRDPFLGNNALLQACREHHTNVIVELIGRGCKINVCNIIGNTPLHIACKSESRNIYSESPTRAPVGGHIDVIRILTNNCCDLDPLNKHLETPIKRAIDGIFEVGQWNIDEDIKITEISNFLDVIAEMIKAGCDVTVIDISGFDLLHQLLKTATVMAAHKALLGDRFRTVVKMLIYAGCPVRTYVFQDNSIDLEQFPDMFAFLLEFLQTPTMLKNCCRRIIRMSVCKPLEVHMPRLMLPPIIQRYVALDVL